MEAGRVKRKEPAMTNDERMASARDALTAKGVQLNAIPRDLADWQQAPFPCLTRMGTDGSVVILLAAIGDRVVGANAHSGSALDWGGDGGFGGTRGTHPTMDLPIPPTLAAEHVAKLREEADTILQRLAANPDAPTVWREADERQLARLERQIAQLTGEPA
jgi:hypothetical protein